MTWKYAGGECWRWVCPAHAAQRLSGRCPHLGADGNQSSLSGARCQRAAGCGPSGAACRSSVAVCNNEPNRSQRIKPGRRTRRVNSLNLRAFLDEAYIGSGDTTSVIDAINQRATLGRLAGTYPYNSKQSNPASPPRYPAATAVQPRFARGMCVHVFSIEFAIGEADGIAPV